jgi:hypothetical protein
MAAPAWELRDDQLTLSVDGTVIKLAEEGLGFAFGDLHERWNRYAHQAGFDEFAIDGISGVDPSGGGEFTLALAPEPQETWGMSALSLFGSLNQDESLYEVGIRGPVEQTSEPRIAAMRVLIRATSPQLDRDTDVDSILSELGIDADGQPQGLSEETNPHGERELVARTTHEGVQYTLTYPRGPQGDLTLVARPSPRERSDP